MGGSGSGNNLFLNNVTVDKIMKKDDSIIKLKDVRIF